jgi:hypothetical protein
MRDPQTINIDPTGPVPAPDRIGRVVLDETKGNLALSAFAAFIFSAAVAVSLLYWSAYFDTGHVPPVTNTVIAAILKFGFLALPALPFLFGELLFPPRVSISYTGVSLRRRAITRTMRWGDLTEVSLQQRIIRDRYGGVTSRTYCLLIGGGRRLILAPIFGVSPAALASYIQSRGQSNAGGTIALTQIPSPVMPPHVRVQLAVLGILGAFAIVLVMAAFGIIRHSAAH